MQNTRQWKAEKEENNFCSQTKIALGIISQNLPELDHSLLWIFWLALVQWQEGNTKTGFQRKNKFWGGYQEDRGLSGESRKSLKCCQSLKCCHTESSLKIAWQSLKCCLAEKGQFLGSSMITARKMCHIKLLWTTSCAPSKGWRLWVPWVDDGGSKHLHFTAK